MKAFFLRPVQKFAAWFVSKTWNWYTVEDKIKLNEAISLLGFKGWPKDIS